MENLCESKTKYWDEQKNQLLKIKDLSYTGAMTTGSNSTVIPKSFSTQKELQSLPKFLIKCISIYSSKKEILFPQKHPEDYGLCFSLFAVKMFMNN